MSRRPVYVDLFCCQGGSSSGLDRLGVDVVGFDILDQPRYPFTFIRADVLKLSSEYLGCFDGAVASPPCQFATRYKNNRDHVRSDHLNLIPETRELLERSGLPWLIENVEDARPELHDPCRVCGTGLGIRIRRHRLFESSMPLEGITCDHGRFTDRPFPGSTNRPNGRTVCNIGEYRVPLATQLEIMEMPWADLHGVSQAVHPRYMMHLGRQLLANSGLEAVA